MKLIIYDTGVNSYISVKNLDNNLEPTLFNIIMVQIIAMSTQDTEWPTAS